MYMATSLYTVIVYVFHNGIWNNDPWYTVYTATSLYTVIVYVFHDGIWNNEHWYIYGYKSVHCEVYVFHKCIF